MRVPLPPDTIVEKSIIPPIGAESRSAVINTDGAAPFPILLFPDPGFPLLIAPVSIRIVLDAVLTHCRVIVSMSSTVVIQVPGLSPDIGYVSLFPMSTCHVIGLVRVHLRSHDPVLVLVMVERDITDH